MFIFHSFQLYGFSFTWKLWILKDPEKITWLTIHIYSKKVIVENAWWINIRLCKCDPGKSFSTNFWVPWVRCHFGYYLTWGAIERMLVHQILLAFKVHTKIIMYAAIEMKLRTIQIKGHCEMEGPQGRIIGRFKLSKKGATPVRVDDRQAYFSTKFFPLS